MKPRITFKKGIWYCNLDVLSGQGKTPKEAWDKLNLLLDIYFPSFISYKDSIKFIIYSI